MDDHENVLPQPSGWDHAHLAVKAAISALPIAGGPAAEVGATTGEDEQAMLLGDIDALSTWHIRLLRFLENPGKFATERHVRTDFTIGGSVSRVLEQVYPELAGRREFYDQIMRDLR